jgi:hypothetical protein
MPLYFLKKNTISLFVINDLFFLLFKLNLKECNFTLCYKLSTFAISAPRAYHDFFI